MADPKSTREARKRESQRRCVAKNKEKYAAKQREYYAKNAERWREHRRRKYAENLELSREKSRRDAKRWREANPDAARAMEKRSQDRYPDRVRAAGRKRASTRRARVFEAFIEVVDPLVVYERARGVCGICLQQIAADQKWHVDHIVPLAKGGAHSYANTQLAHARCNQSKGAKVA